MEIANKLICKYKYKYTNGYKYKILNIEIKDMIIISCYIFKKA